jgi:hypothetical protein
MTEAEWLACTDPTPMLDYLEARDCLTERKQRLFDCACVRRVWHLLVDERGRKAVEIAEKFADGAAGLEELRQAQGIALAAADTHATLYLPGTADSYSVLAAASAAAWEFRSGADPLGHAADAIAWERRTERLTENWPEGRWPDAKRAAERKTQANLLREVIGNPFRPVAVSPSCLAWNHGTVVTLAHGIYDERAFDRLPILSDALEEAGCTDRAILDHCRGPGPHARGCWAVDLLLCKA